MKNWSCATGNHNLGVLGWRVSDRSLVGGAQRRDPNQLRRFRGNPGGSRKILKPGFRTTYAGRFIWDSIINPKGSQAIMHWLRAISVPVQSKILETIPEAGLKHGAVPCHCPSCIRSENLYLTPSTGPRELSFSRSCPLTASCCKWWAGDTTSKIPAAGDQRNQDPIS